MAVTARGSNTQLLVRPQADFVTAASLVQTAKWWTLPVIPPVDFRPVGDVTEDDVILAGAPSAQPRDQVRGLRSAAFDLTVPIGQQSFGFWLRMLLGAPVTTGTSPNFVHNFRTLDVPTIPSFTAWQYYSDINRRMVTHGCTVNQIQFQFSRQGRSARATVSGVAIAQAPTTDEADATPVAFANDSSQVEFNGDIYRDGAALTDEVSGFSLTVSNGIGLDQECFNGTDRPSLLISPRFSGSGSITARFKDVTFYNAARNGTDVALEFRLVVGANNRFNIILPRVRLSDYGNRIDNDDQITVTIPFVVLRPASGNAITLRYDSQVTNSYAAL